MRLGGWPALLLLGLLCACGPGAGSLPPDGGVARQKQGAGRPRDDAVLCGLRWLAAHACADGHWDPASGDPGLAQHDVAATALTTLAFLGAGYIHRGDHEFADVVRRALAWLRDQQDGHGFIVTHSHATRMWDHSLATLALVEAYGMSESTFLLPSVRAALRALTRLRDPDGVWSYPVAAGGLEESLTLWALMPLYNAKYIDDDAARRDRPRTLDVDTAGIDAGRAWLDRNTDAATGLLTLGRWEPADENLPGTNALTLGALGLWARVMDCQDSKVDGPLKRGRAALDAASFPRREGQPDPDDLLWWIGTRVTFTRSDARWQRWDAALRAEVLPAQTDDGAYSENRGSWRGRGATGRLGGRVLATALLTLSQEIYYRYDNHLVPCWLVYEATKGEATEEPVPLDEIPPAPEPSETEAGD